MKFLHIRNYDFSDEIVKNMGGATFAYDVENGVLKWAAAFCNPNDNFNKKIGRTIASGRYKNERNVFPEKGELVLSEGEVLSSKLLIDKVIHPMYNGFNVKISKIGKFYVYDLNF